MNLGSKLHRHQGGRKQIARSLLRSLFEYGKVETSEPRARVLKKITDRILSIAKKGNLQSIKRVSSIFEEDRLMVKKVYGMLPLLGDKTSGFTKTVRLGKRIGDGSERMRVELIKIVKLTDTPKIQNEDKK